MNQLYRYYLCFADDTELIKTLRECLGNTEIVQVQNAIAILVKYHVANTVELQERLADLGSCESRLETYFPEIIGYSTLLINGQGMDSSALWALRFDESEIRDGLLRFNINNRLVHRYEYQIRTGVDLDNFLQTFMKFDLKVFTVGYEAYHFKGQMEVMVEERKNVDAAVEGILYSYASGKINAEDKLDLWEKNIQDLSGAFSTLGSYLPLVKRMESSLAKGIDDIYTAMKKFKNTVPETDPMVQITVGWVKTRMANIHKFGEDLAISRDNAHAAMNVVQTQIELVRTKEEMLLQQQMGAMLKQNVVLLKEGIALQVAAAFIEFIVVNYYSLSIWKTVAPEEAFHHIPGWLKLLMVCTFAASAVVCTHFVGERSMHPDKKANTGLIASILALLVVFISMVIISLVY